MTTNSGSPWKKIQNVLVQAEVSSDTSGRCFAGVVDFVNGLTRITANEFDEDFSKGTNVFAQDLTKLQGIFCFPPIPVIGMIIKYLEQQEVDCVIVIYTCCKLSLG